MHAGSLYAAVASFLDARANAGTWLVRIEDLDPPREQPGADRLILDCLQRHGMVSDEPVLYQSTRHIAYEQALERLLDGNIAYWCTCSRSDFAQHPEQHAPDCPGVSEPRPDNQASIRARFSQDAPYTFTDRLQGLQCFCYNAPIDDFVLLRKDGLFSYQLAVVVDDAEQTITHVVRGTDLIDSTARQIWLQHALSLPTPCYAHIPVIVDASGNKLSKQRFAKPVNADTPLQNLIECFRWLGIANPPSGACRSVHELLDWGTQNWSAARIPDHDVSLDT